LNVVQETVAILFRVNLRNQGLFVKPNLAIQKQKTIIHEQSERGLTIILIVIGLRWPRWNIRMFLCTEKILQATIGRVARTLV